MYRFIRTVKITGGKFGEAVAWSKEISGFVKDKLDAPEPKLYLDSFGEVGTLYWTAEYKNLEQLEKVQNNMLGNKEYWNLVNQAWDKNLFIDGTLQDRVLKEIE